ncbi:major capsid protein [Capybara microvirus Cap3_SP_416]|nr:major capsid protein [Capybara microvirus Cap3_SP_416]
MKAIISNPVVSESQLNKSKFSFDRDVITTHNWGEIQPINCRLLHTGDQTVDFSCESLVRVAPLVAPTFSRIYLHQYHCFVPLQDLSDKFDHMLSGVKYSTYSATVLAEEAPNVTPSSLLLLLLLNHSRYEILQQTNLSGIYEPVTELVQGLDFNHQNSDLFYDMTGHATNLSAGSSSAVFVSSDLWNPENGDIVLRFQANHIPDVHGELIYSFKLTESGKRLRKVLIGLGYALGISDIVPLSLFPLFAFYKAQFDVFRLPQYENYETTNCYKCLNYYNQHGNFVITNSSNPATRLVPFIHFLNDLGQCFYSEPLDFVSSHINKTTNQVSTDYQSMNVVNYDGAQYSLLNLFTSGSLQLSHNRALNFDQISDDILKKFYYRVQKDTVIGQQIGALLKSRGYSEWINENMPNCFGHTTVPIEVSDVFSTASTDSAALGEYAGKAVKYNQSNNFHYENRSIGFLISFSCVVPESGYVNALDPSLLCIDKNSFYQPEFDGLGYEVTPQASIYGVPNYQFANDDNFKGFGFIPRYSGLKQCSNILNGDMSLWSLRHTYLPYQLEKMIFKRTMSSELDSAGRYIIKSIENDIPVAGPAWRYPTKYPWLGNFNRIFRQMESSGQIVAPDNFIDYTIIKMSVYAPMKPISESWQSISEDEFKKFEVQNS